jgi:UDP-2-acetamido-3-amino-2,3-dideoxy-glucuronate N-acetyltransferase
MAISNKAKIHPSAIVDDGAQVGAGTKIWHFCHVMGSARIGEKCVLGQNVYVGPNVTIGNNVHIQNNVSVYEGVTLEDDVFCGPSMVFTNVLGPRSAFPVAGPGQFSPTLVKRGASLGANCTIVCGNTIGGSALVGAGAVVTRDVPDFALVAGVPAAIVGYVCACGESLGEVDKGEKVDCRKCGREYERETEGLNAL